jgi:hypothetical protein
MEFFKSVWSLAAAACVIASMPGCIASSTEELDDEGETTDSSDQALALSPALRIGMGGSTGPEFFGRGPTYSGGEWTEANPYTMVLGRIPPKDLAAKIEQAKQKNMLIVLNMAGSRNNWTHAQTSDGRTCLIYDVSLWKPIINEYIGVPGLASALADRRVILYVVDEPQIDDFCDSITPTEANAMGLYLKNKWPGAITLIRAGGETLKKGFAGQGPLGANFWSGMDYGYGLYKGWANDKIGKTPAQWYPEEKKRLSDLNLGMVFGINILNHGQSGCWDYKNDGQSHGRIRGQNQALNGGIPCSQGMGDENNWLASPGFLRSIADAAMQDADAPFIAMWTHITPSSNDQEFKQYEVRSDFVSAYKYMIAKGKQRTQWNGWRKAK